MPHSQLTPIPFEKVNISSAFWAEKIDTIRRKTTRYCVRRCEETGRIANFRRAAKMEEGGFEGIYFNDSDVYKVLEGIAYTLLGGADKELEAAADTIIDAICRAQQPDGYLFTYFILTGLENRFTDMGYHEAYCLGHMLEAAIAYKQATGKDCFLNTAQKALRHMMGILGPGKRHWVTGHQELELAVMKLYTLTGDADYLNYARWLISERGHGYLDSADFRRQNFHSDYCQDDLPAESLQKVTGHAVRAMYYYSAMADVAAATNNKPLRDALERLYNNVVPANLYITGGIGQDAANEGFTRDWHLPNLTAYCETCASIGMAMWNHRMNLLFSDAKYADLVETELYNGILAGISSDGLKFFYENPLASVGRHRRSEWFGCSCCPTNLVRFIPSVGGYAYAKDGETICINQYIASDTDFGSVRTNYPWDGRVEIQLKHSAKLRLRIPAWCANFTLTLNRQSLSAPILKGYAQVEIEKPATLVLEMDMPIRQIHADARVKECKGRVAFARGPIIYCAEQIDQTNCELPTEYFHADFAINTAVEAHTEPFNDMLALRIGPALLIPYYAWCNREACGMVVWAKELP